MTLDEIPTGTLVAVYGKAASGKTHVIMDRIGKLHQSDAESVVLYFDTDFRSMSHSYMEQFGVDLDRIIIYETNDIHVIDRVLKDIDYYITEGAPIKMVVLNNLAGVNLHEQSERVVGPDGEIINAKPIAIRAILYGAIMRKLADLAHKHGIYVNVAVQVRANLDGDGKPYVPSPNAAKVSDYLVEVDKCQVESITKVEKEANG